MVKSATKVKEYRMLHTNSIEYGTDEGKSEAFNCLDPVPAHKEMIIVDSYRVLATVLH